MSVPTTTRRAFGICRNPASILNAKNQRQAVVPARLL